MLNVEKIKKDFPIFQSKPNLVYLDSAATSLKPKTVIEKMVQYYEKYPANIHRGIYEISERATQEYEKTRQLVAEFIGAQKEEIIFTRNTTESINLLAFGLVANFLKREDEILISIMEHHSNFVPWQQLAKKFSLKLKILDIDSEGHLKIEDLKNMISPKTKVISLTYVSNVLGIINPIREIVKIAKSQNPKIILSVDAAQAIPHLKIDVGNLGCDFLAFSAHKILGPTGVGVLWGKRDLLERLSPLNFGGGMIEEVKITKTKFKPPPWCFEAGTPNISGVVAFQEAINYLNKIGFQNIEHHTKKLTNLAFLALKEEFGSQIKLLGPQNPKERTSLLSFVFDKIHPHDIAQLLDRQNICLRAGHHCCLPLHQRLKIPASARISFYIYNDSKDIERLILGLKKIKKFLKI